MALLGAELLFYPTAIGSEPILQNDSQPHWMRCMQGHAAANIMPVIASNRIGTETEGDSFMTFYGSRMRQARWRRRRTGRVRRC